MLIPIIIAGLSVVLKTAFARVTKINGASTSRRLPVTMSFGSGSFRQSKPRRHQTSFVVYPFPSSHPRHLPSTGSIVHSASLPYQKAPSDAFCQYGAGSTNGGLDGAVMGQATAPDCAPSPCGRSRANPRIRRPSIMPSRKSNRIWIAVVMHVGPHKEGRLLIARSVQLSRVFLLTKDRVYLSNLFQRSVQKPVQNALELSPR